MLVSHEDHKLAGHEEKISTNPIADTLNNAKLETFSLQVVAPA